MDPRGNLSVKFAFLLGMRIKAGVGQFNKKNLWRSVV